jgi:hypothetical protein
MIVDFTPCHCGEDAWTLFANRKATGRIFGLVCPKSTSAGRVFPTLKDGAPHRHSLSLFAVCTAAASIDFWTAIRIDPKQAQPVFFWPCNR